MTNMLEQLQQLARRHGFGAHAIRELEQLLAIATPRPPTLRLDDAEHRASIAPLTESDFRRRYEVLGTIGSGGFSEVNEAWDRHVQRHVALKTQLPSPSLSEDALRFRREVHIMARLQHPGIVPVHDWGELPDGRIWFTMKRVYGTTIAPRISHLYTLQGPDFNQALRRLLDDFRRLCEPVAYAHKQSIIHRDLTPHNLMIGEFGEVHVMDWGLARDMSTIPGEGMTTATDTMETSSTTAPKLRTRAAGTPYYTPPEQARGDLSAMGPASDVYTLGAVLYELLSGKPPYYRECDATDGPKRILRRVLDGPPRTIESVARPEAPRELCILCSQAMARSPQDRSAHAGILMDSIRDWLDGANRVARARRIVVDADRDHRAKIETLRQRSEELRTQAREILSQLRSFDPAQKKAEGWALEDEAATIERDILREEITWTRLSRERLNDSEHFRSRFGSTR